MKLLKSFSMAIVVTLSLQAEVKRIETQLPVSEAGGANALAMSGEWLALGAYDINSTSKPNKTCYVDMYKVSDYTTTPLTWQWIELIGGAKGNCSGNKGFGLAVSLNGTRLAISSTENFGEVRLYSLDSANDTWVEGVTIPNPEASDTGFAETLSIHGNYLVVGAPRYNDGIKLEAGRVYLYDWDTAVELSTPSLIGNKDNEHFGTAVTAKDLGSGVTRIGIGAPGYDIGLGETNEGAAFLYQYDGSNDPILEETLIGRIQGAEVGAQVALGTTQALVSGLAAHAFIQETVDSLWMEGLTMLGLSKGDVSISQGVSAGADLGGNVHIYTKLDNVASPYFVDVAPSNSVAGETGEDISFSKDQLLVKQSTTTDAFLYDFPCGYGSDLVEYEWAIVSVPCGSGAATIGDIFVDDLGTYGNSADWVMYEQNASTDYNGTFTTMREMLITDAMVLGRGYWIITDANSTWKADDNVISLRTSGDILNDGLGSIPNDTIKKYYEYSLPSSTTIEQKVMVGNPYPRTLQWENMYFSHEGTVVRIDDATNATPYINPIAYVYDITQEASGQPYRSITVNTPGTSGEIAPNQGFWITLEANQTGVNVLEIPFEK